MWQCPLAHAPSAGVISALHTTRKSCNENRFVVSLARLCERRQLLIVTTFSSRGWRKTFGVHLKERRVTDRAVFVMDKAGVVRYVEYVPEISSHPNYDAALQALQQAAGK